MPISTFSDCVFESISAPGPWLPVYRLIRPAPVGSVNSESLMPTLRSTHSTWSTEPVAMAILGMSPWFRFCGITTRLAGNAVFWHAVVAGITICRRHRPDTITNGIFTPTGTSSMVKVPSTFDSVPTSGDPDGGAPTTGQLTPAVNCATGAFGM